MAGGIIRYRVASPSAPPGGVVFGTTVVRDQATVLNRTLASWSGDLTALTDTVPVSAGGLVVGEGFFLSPRAGQLFVELAREAAGRGPFRLTVDADGPHVHCDPLNRLSRIDVDGRKQIALDVAYVPPGQSAQTIDAAWWQTLTPISISSRVVTRRMPLPVDAQVSGANQREFAWTNAPLGPTWHWTELVRTNVIALFGAPRPNAGSGSPLARYFRAVAKSWRLSGPRLAAAMNSIGSDVQIHPSAVVEGADIGRGARIGPHAVVRGSVIGAGAVIGSQAIVDFSIVGAGAEIQRRAMAAMSVVGAKARAGGILQLGYLGAGATTKMFSVGTDMKLDGPVRVRCADGLREVDMGYQGVCIAENAFVGSGVWVAPGRVVGAGAVVGRARDAMTFDVDAAADVAPPTGADES